MVAGQGDAGQVWRRISQGRVLAWLLVAVLTLVIGALLWTTRTAVLRIIIDAPREGVAQLFWDNGQGFSEAGSTRVRYAPGRTELSFALPADDYRRLRFDPARSDANVVVVSVGLAGGGPPNVDIGVDAWAPSNGVAELVATDGGVRVVAVPGTSDPQLLLDVGRPLPVRPPPLPAGSLLWTAVFAALAGVGLILATSTLPARVLVAMGLAAGLCAIVAIGAISPVHMVLHPDERLHLACLGHFLAHAWPPAASSPEMVQILRTSVWGISYLNSWDVVYFLAGHFTRGVEGLAGSPMAGARLFQNLLWLGLLALAMARRSWAMSLAALLVSPQIWYVFSYFNGDALPLFLSMCAVALVAEDGAMDRYLRGDRPGLVVAAFAVCIGLLLVSKANFYPVVLAAVLWLGVRNLDLRWHELGAVLVAAGCLAAGSMLGNWAPSTLQPMAGPLKVAGVLLLFAGGAVAAWRCWRIPHLRAIALRLGAVGLVALLVAAPRIAGDMWINGGPQAKAAAVLEATERHARQDYRPSIVDSGGGDERLRLARRGVSLGGMLFGEHDWIGRSWKSAFGVYSYMNVHAPAWTYPALGSTCLALWLLAVVSTIRGHGGRGGRLSFVAVGAAGLVLFIAMLYSWLYSFQPQGRYLLPMVPMLGLLLPSALRVMPATAKGLLLVSTLLSIVSMGSGALPGIAARAAG